MTHTSIGQLAQLAPYVIYKNQIYQIAQGLDTKDKIIISGCEFGLSPGPILSEVDRYYTEINHENIFKYKREYIQQKLKKEMVSDEAKRKLVGKERVLNFILTELFPLIVDDGTSVKAALSGQVQSAASNPLDSLTKNYDIPEEEIARIKKEIIEGDGVAKPPQPRETDPLKSLLRKAYGMDTTRFRVGEAEWQSKNVFLYEGKVYEFATEGEHEITIGGRTYKLEATETIEALVQRYHNHKKKKYMLEALDEFEDRIKEIGQARRRNEAIREFVEKQEYSIGDAGYIWRGDSIWLYRKLPAFAMQHPLNKSDYYAFESCRVAIKISSDEQTVMAGSPYVIEPIGHPFLSGKKSWNKLCMGPYTARDVRSAAGIARHLSASVNVVLNGYTNTCHPYNALDKFSENKMILEEAEAKGLKITNLH